MEARYLYISLVGTSVLRNTAMRLKDKWRDKYPDLENWHSLPLDDARNVYNTGLLCRLRTADPELYEDMLNEAMSLGEKASAEVAGVVGLAGTLIHSYDKVHVVLYPTATCNSLLSAEINKAVLKGLGFRSIEVQPIEKLGKLEEFEEGLVELLDKVVPRILEAGSKGMSVYLNATPGFKAESSFLVLSSLLAGVKGVVYIHETFREPVFIPAVPISVEKEFAEWIKSLGDEIPREVWSTIPQLMRQELTERGLVKQAGEVYVVRKWVWKLLEKLQKNRGTDSRST
ncbi:MAG: putative CRISPR-associated protein [Desulfurococcaceae archaeon]